MSFRLLLACLAGLSLAFAACDKKGKEDPSETTAKAPDPTKLLDAAIKARGGLAKLKATSSWTGKWTGISRGMVHNGTQVFKDGQIRRDFTMPNGEKVTVVRGRDQCWTTMGDKLIPCSAAEKRFAGQGVALNHASSLWPLKEKNWQLSAGDIQVGKQDYDSLKARNTELGANITLILNKKTHLASRIILHNVTLNNQTGDVVAEIIDKKKFCDVVFYTNSLVEFAGKRLATNQLKEIECGPVDDKVFAQPEAEAATETKPADQPKKQPAKQ